MTSNIFIKPQLIKSNVGIKQWLHLDVHNGGELEVFVRNACGNRIRSSETIQPSNNGNNNGSNGWGTDWWHSNPTKNNKNKK